MKEAQLHERVRELKARVAELERHIMANCADDEWHRRLLAREKEEP